MSLLLFFESSLLSLFSFFWVSLWHGFSTTRLTNHANNFLNTKGHARKKPQLAGYFLLRFIGSLCHEQDNRLTSDHSSHLFDAQLVVSVFLCCRGIRDIPSVPTVDLHALPSFELLRHSANFMRERGGGAGFSRIKLQHTAEIECNVHHVLICRVFAGTECIWQYGPLEGTLY